MLATPRRCSHERVEKIDTQQKILLRAIFFVNVFLKNKVPISVVNCNRSVIAHGLPITDSFRIRAISLANASDSSASYKGLASPLKSALSEEQCDCPSDFIRGTFFPEPFALVRKFRFIDSLKQGAFGLLFFCGDSVTMAIGDLYAGSCKC